MTKEDKKSFKKYTKKYLRSSSKIWQKTDIWILLSNFLSVSDFLNIVCIFFIRCLMDFLNMFLYIFSYFCFFVTFLYVLLYVIYVFIENSYNKKNIFGNFGIMSFWNDQLVPVNSGKKTREIPKFTTNFALKFPKNGSNDCIYIFSNFSINNRTNRLQLCAKRRN